MNAAGPASSAWRTVFLAPSFAKRPGFVRLMTALSPTPPVQVLVIFEESRLGRKAIETTYTFERKVTAVRVFYLEDGGERRIRRGAGRRKADEPGAAAVRGSANVLDKPGGIAFTEGLLKALDVPSRVWGQRLRCADGGTRRMMAVDPKMERSI